MKKEIYLQTQSMISSSISSVKQVGWVSLNTDNIKIVIDAYNGFPALNQPREDSLVTIADKNMVYECTPAQLITMVEFFCAYHVNADQIVHYKNRNHPILPDRFKNALKLNKKGLEL
jgi:hypothetical protein